VRKCVCSSVDETESWTHEDNVSEGFDQPHDAAAAELGQRCYIALCYGADLYC